MAMSPDGGRGTGTYSDRACVQSYNTWPPSKRPDASRSPKALRFLTGTKLLLSSLYGVRTAPSLRESRRAPCRVPSRLEPRNGDTLYHQFS